MKNLTAIVLAAIILSACNNAPKEQNAETTDPIPYSFAEIWSTDTVMSTPESVLYDPNGDQLFVANVAGNPTDMDGNGTISKLGKDGSIIDLKWATGMNAPKGMGIFENTLYVADIDHLRAINLSDGSIAESYPIEGASFLNDVTVGKHGEVYVSDMQTGKVHVLKNGEITDWITENYKGVNGLYDMGDKIIINAAGSGEVRKVNKETMEYEVLATGIGGDGVEYTGIDGVFIVSEWKGKVHVVTPDSVYTVIDSEAQKINTADIGFNMKEKMVYVPTFFDNRVVAYKLVTPEQ